MAKNAKMVELRKELMGIVDVDVLQIGVEKIAKIK